MIYILGQLPPPDRPSNSPLARRPTTSQKMGRNASRPTGNSTDTRRTPVNPADVLPDIVRETNILPPYSTLPHSDEWTNRRVIPVIPILPIVPRNNLSGSAANPGCNAGRDVRRHVSSRNPRYTPDEQAKRCCGMSVAESATVRWFIVVIAFVGLCCAVVGTVLGALKVTGKDHLTISLLMIGIGVLLVALSAVTWRLTSSSAPPCRALLGLTSVEEDMEHHQRFSGRVQTDRPQHPYAAMMYPEFRCRPPPPSYQASMQEYRLRLLLLDRQAPHASPIRTAVRGSSTGTHGPTVNDSPTRSFSMNGRLNCDGAVSVSPPPTYRSRGTRPPTMIQIPESEYSCPPSYRSRDSGGEMHSLDQSTNSIGVNRARSAHDLASNSQNEIDTRPPPLPPPNARRLGIAHRNTRPLSCDGLDAMAYRNTRSGTLPSLKKGLGACPRNSDIARRHQSLNPDQARLGSIAVCSGDVRNYRSRVPDVEVPGTMSGSQLVGRSQDSANADFRISDNRRVTGDKRSGVVEILASL